ncbi:hypothetical protein ACFSL6_17670 [Paenibacillus thailandensis]|uniref:Uncharacterized protein n=1 Tax=Paenibacillus thailandensis TaxID=393250 RepID=A0ABW5QTV9_9BACL
MGVVKNLMIRAGADFSGMRKELSKARQDLADFKNNVSNTMKAIGGALAAVGIGTVFKDATRAAMTFESSIQQLNRTMGTNAKAFVEWANANAQAFGMGRREVIQYGAVYSNLLSSFFKDTRETTKYTQELLRASAVVSVATGRQMEDVMERIRSGLLGETDAIEDLGINVNVAMLESTAAFRRFAGDKSWEQLDFQTQSQIRLMAILEQSTQKYGNEVANNTNAKMNQFVAALKDVQLYLGQAFLPILNIVLPILTKLASALATVMNVVAQFSQALFGKTPAKEAQAQAKATNSQAAAVGDLGDAYKQAGKEAKKAAGSVAGFDEVNTLATGGAEAVGGAAAGSGVTGSAGSTDLADLTPDLGGFAESTVQVSEKVREMATKIKTAFAEMSSFIQQHKDLIIAALAGIGAAIVAAFLITQWSAIVGAIAKAMSAIGAAFAGLFSPVGLIVAAIAAAVAAFVYFYRTNETFRGVVDGILKAIGEAAKWLWENVMVPFGEWLSTKGVEYWEQFKDAMSKLWNDVLVPLGKWLGNVFVKAWDVVSDAAKWLWNNVLAPFGTFLSALWVNVLQPLAVILGDVLGVAFDTVARIAQSFWQNVLVPLGQALSQMFGPAIEAVTSVLRFLWTNGFEPLGKFLKDTMLPIWTELTKALEYVWNEVLKPLAAYVADVFVGVLDNAFRGIGDVIQGAKEIFVGLMDFITGVFTGNWEKAWNGIKGVFKGVFDSLAGVIKVPLNSIIDAINAMINGINKIKIDVPKWVQEITGYTSFGFNIPKIPKLARGGFVDGATNMGNYIAGEAGRELIVPLENTSFTDKIASALGTAVLTAMQVGQVGRGNGDIVIQISGVELARVTAPYNNAESSRLGNALIQTT